jgi:hypothetical protein
MPVAGPILQNNKFESEQFPVNSIQAVIPTKIVTVKYTDGYGKGQTRLVALIGDLPYLLPEEVSGKARSCQSWFIESLREHMGMTKNKEVAKKDKDDEKSVEIPKINLDAM